MGPAAFEAIVCKVGVIRLSSGKQLGPSGFVGFDRFTKFDRKSPEALRLNVSGNFSDSSQMVV